MQIANFLNTKNLSAQNRPFLPKYILALSSILYILIPFLYHSNTLWRVSPFLILIPSLILTAWYGGLLPGLLATLIGIGIGDYFFTTPFFTFSINNTDDLLRIALFTLAGIFISTLSQLLHNSLAQTKLHAEQLEELNTQKSTFLTLVAHELKTPIAIIRVITDLLIEQSKATLDQEPIKDLSLELDRLTLLIEDLLDISRIERGNLKINKTTMNLSETITEIVEHMRVIEKTHTLNWEKHSPLLIQADQARIKQVLINLIGNALQHSPKQTTITIKLKKQPDKIVVSVQDKGIGIPETEQTAIFDKFYQVKDYFNQGFGLGLYISKEIINQHKGKIWVDSKPGKGSTFYFSLPRESS